MVFRSMALGMILSVVAVALASLTLLPALLVALGDRVLVRKNTDDPDITAESRWQRVDRRRAAPPGRGARASGSSLLGALIVPAFGMHLGMPGAQVVDKGNTSRDGYDMLVGGVRSRRRRARVHHHPGRRRADGRRRSPRRSPGVVDARVVTAPAPTGRVVVRVTGSTAVDDSRTATLVNTLRARLATAVPGARVGGPAAQNRDLTAVLTGRAPYAIGAHPDRRVPAAARSCSAASSSRSRRS